MKKNKTLLLKFVITGSFATFINLIVFFLFTEIIKLYYIYSAFFAFLIADISKYLISNKWVFVTYFKRNFFKTYIKFFLISTSAFLINLFFLYYLTEFLRIYYFISYIIALVISLFFNFIFNKNFTFRETFITK
jgi:putative flippase GtrA